MSNQLFSDTTIMLSFILLATLFIAIPIALILRAIGIDYQIAAFIAFIVGLIISYIYLSPIISSILAGLGII